MCGLTGFLTTDRSTREELLSQVESMSCTLYRRGPDDSGAWADAESGIALGFRRLAIVDLTPEGHQPMTSADGRYVIIFNGEVYNFQELRAELEPRGHRFRGHSDTEVMLAAFREWGIEAALRRFNGMFAIALWDRQERLLTLARDRVGKKPLYYGWSKGTFLFGSELKALSANRSFVRDINRSAVALFLKFGYVPGPHSIYEGIRKLPAGTYLQMSLARKEEAAEPRPYWSALEIALAGERNQLQLSDDEAVERLDSLLRDSVRLRMIADVPLGAFLSGGIDSSTVVALMQAQSAKPVRTFSIGFTESEFNEANYAADVARHLGTDHTELYVSPQQALDVIPHLPAIYDEPFADSSQVPTFLVSQLARRDVTVSLSGDGGDELFGGYNRYFWTQRMWRGITAIPRPLRRGVGRTLLGMKRSHRSRLLAGMQALMPRNWRVQNPDEKIVKAAELLTIHSWEEIYERLVSHWKEPFDVVRGASPVATVFDKPADHAAFRGIVHQMMYLDLVSYLPDDILVKVDRASMAVSLEGRCPLLDHRVVEFAWRLPMEQKIRRGVGKWIVRKVLARYVPDSLIDRPKMGFGIPIGQWLRGPLRDWAEELLSERRLRDEGFFEPKPVRTMWSQHLAGTRDNQYYLWDVLMFQAWLEHSRGPASLPAAPAIGTIPTFV
jgi:asparagine synthase (glutamine-hydrolysing)